MTEEIDAYEVARHVAHYQRKNGYSIRVHELRRALELSEDAIALLERNDVIALRPLHDAGPRICVVLTEKGERMQREPRPLRAGRRKAVEA